MITTIASAIVMLLGFLLLIGFAVALLYAIITKGKCLPDARIEKKVDDIRNTVCMLSDLILEETPEGQRFLEKHPDYFENSKADEKN